MTKEEKCDIIELRITIHKPNPKKEENTMTTEKYLSLINKAIDNLKDNEDGYGKTPIEFMRKAGVKSTDNMTFFLDSVGAYLEEIRCGLIADIESAEAKKNGKSTVLSNVKKFAKKCAENRELRPRLGWADYDEENNCYFILDGCALLVAENSEGLELLPESVKNSTSPFNYRGCMPDLYGYSTMELPPVGKIAAYRKSTKSKVNTRTNKEWDKIFFPEFGINGEYLEMFMKITGSTRIWWKNSTSCLYMEGNGYKAVIMPIKKNPETLPTNFEEA